MVSLSYSLRHQSWGGTVEPPNLTFFFAILGWGGAYAGGRNLHSPPGPPCRSGKQYYVLPRSPRKPCSHNCFALGLGPTGEDTPTRRLRRGREQDA